MNVQSHNSLMKIVFGGTKHFNHVLTSDQIRKSDLLENRYPLTRLPVCGHCERLALWYKENAYCPECGTVTHSPITYSSYLASGYDLETKAGTNDGIAKRMLEIDKRKNILPNYGE